MSEQQISDEQRADIVKRLAHLKGHILHQFSESCIQERHVHYANTAAVRTRSAVSEMNAGIFRLR